MEWLEHQSYGSALRFLVLLRETVNKDDSHARIFIQFPGAGMTGLELSQTEASKRCPSCAPTLVRHNNQFKYLHRGEFDSVVLYLPY
jgi:hypothetical protein